MEAPSAVRLAVTLALLVVLAGVAVSWTRTHVLREIAVAVARGSVQLILVAGVIGWIFAHPGALVPYLLVMVTVATLTATRRAGRDWRLAPRLALAISAGAAGVVLISTTTGAISRDANTLLPYTAQVIGGSMVAASLAAGRFRDDVASGWPEVEGWLTLGASPRQAVADLGRRAVARALVPPVDQLAGAGLVTLPGAFVGLLLAGARPLAAAELQLLVLVGMVAAEAVSAALTVTLIAASLGRKRPALV
ncbi:MAG TPA: ABC transporter permease [Propionicimonas sp.]